MFFMHVHEHFSPYIIAQNERPTTDADCVIPLQID